ncbi:hypothetical protein R5R35_006884 [Gryllus longicercus]|uniref:Uncharacterized protein n=1 Tax=Gryllus longicercus TaxID=2509291 RepID=A0AAN9YVR0_9ORTH
MRSSVDLIQVVVPTKTPNVLPHCKIRDNPHVSSEEWEFLKQQSSQKPFSNSSETISVASGDEGSLEETQENASLGQGTEQQRVFVELVAGTAR